MTSEATEFVRHLRDLFVVLASLAPPLVESDYTHLDDNIADRGAAGILRLR
jgi:hypothetical protein